MSQPYQLCYSVHHLTTYTSLAKFQVMSLAPLSAALAVHMQMLKPGVQHHTVIKEPAQCSLTSYWQFQCLLSFHWVINCRMKSAILMTNTSHWWMCIPVLQTACKCIYGT